MTSSTVYSEMRGVADAIRYTMQILGNRSSLATLTEYGQSQSNYIINQIQRGDDSIKVFKKEVIDNDKLIDSLLSEIQQETRVIWIDLRGNLLQKTIYKAFTKQVTLITSYTSII